MAILDKIIKIAPMVLATVETLSSMFSKTADHVAKSQPIDKSSSAEDVENLIEEFEKCKEIIYKESSKLEREVKDEVEAYVGECLGHLSQHENILKRYDIHIERIKRNLRKIETGLEYDIKDSIDKEVTFGNRRLQDIVRMLPGTQKEQAMMEFMNKAFEKILEDYCIKIHSKLSDIYEEIEEKLFREVDVVANDTKQMCERMNLLKDDMDNEDTEKITRESISFFAKCNAIESVLAEVE